MVTYFHDSWKSSTFAAAYSERSKDMPLVLKDVITRGVCNAPSIMKKIWYPKKRWIPSNNLLRRLKSAKPEDVECATILVTIAGPV